MSINRCHSEIFRNLLNQIHPNLLKNLFRQILNCSRNLLSMCTAGIIFFNKIENTIRMSLSDVLNSAEATFLPKILVNRKHAQI